MPSFAVDFTGLVTAPGLLARAQASCVSLLNLQVTAPGLLQSRRGFSRAANGYGGPAFKVMTSRAMGTNVLVHSGASATGGTQLRYGDGSAAAVAVTSIDGGDIARPVDGKTRMELVLNQDHHYVTADNGVRRLSLGPAGVRYAGMPRGEGIDCYDMVAATHTILVGAPGTALLDGYARAYRVTWHLGDLAGPPTGRTLIRNQAGTSGYAVATVRNCALRIPIPVEWGTFTTALTTSYEWRLWGTRSFDAAGGAIGDDECFLVAQGALTAPEIAAGFVAYTDSTPDGYLIGSPRLNTNASNYPPGDEGVRQGIVNADDPPPKAARIAYHQDVMWYANTEVRQLERQTLLSVGVGGFVAGSTVQVVGTSTVTLTGVAGAPAVATEFTIVAGLPTLSMNIEATARNLVACINRNAAATGIRAYHVSTSRNEPGLLMAEFAKPSTTGAVVALLSPSVPAAFRVTSSSLDIAPNRIYFSKPGRPDAVPPINTFDVAGQGTRILKIIPYRERLLVFTDVGIYQVTGRTFADFAVSPLDLTYRLLAPETVVACDDRVYAWCFEGIIEVDDSGARVVSQPIEDFTLAQSRSLQSATEAYAFAVAYRRSHEVRFFYPAQNSVNLRQSNFWVSFQTQTRAWARGFFNATTESGVVGDGRSSGVVRWEDDRLVLVNWNSTSADSWLFTERAANSAADFVDDFSNATSGAIQRQAVFQYGVPNPQGALHWRSAVWSFDNTVIQPTSVLVAFSNELSSPGEATVAVGSRAVVRVEPPRVVRRGSWLRANLFVDESSVDLRLVGLSLDFVGPTATVRR